MGIPTSYEAIGLNKIIHVGEIPKDSGLGGTSRYYQLKTYHGKNGCPLFADALGILKAFDIPFKLHEEPLESAPANLGVIHYVWFSIATEKEYQAYLKSPFARKHLSEKSNQSLSFLLKDEYLEIKTEVEEKMSWGEEAPW